MSADPIPTFSPSLSPGDLENLREYGPKQFRARGAHALAKRLEWLLERHVPDLERRLAASEDQRRTFEAEAEGTFAELRLHLRDWQTYAAQLDERCADLTLQLSGVRRAVQRLARCRWWEWRARREARRDIATWCQGAAELLLHSGPTPPPVDRDG